MFHGEKSLKTPPLSLKSPGILLKGLLLKVAILAKKLKNKFSKNQKHIKKQLKKTIHPFQNEFQKIKNAKTNSIRRKFRSQASDNMDR